MEQNAENYDLVYEYLLRKYNRITIGKKEMAAELGIGLSTLDLYMKKGIGIPSYLKLGNKRNSRILFNITDVAEFLSSNKIKTL